MADHEDFTTNVTQLRFYTGRPYNKLGEASRWQLLAPRSDTYVRSVEVVEDRVPVERALEIATLLGCRDQAVEAMAAEARTLAEESRTRLVRSREERARAEEMALEDRRGAERIRAVVSRVSTQECTCWPTASDPNCPCHRPTSTPKAD